MVGGREKIKGAEFATCSCFLALLFRDYFLLNNKFNLCKTASPVQSCCEIAC